MADPIRPTFLVVGAMKAGTTSLAAYLKAHPQVCMSKDKEPHFFTRRFDRGMDWYLGLFDHCGDAVAVGEASTSYTMAPRYPQVPARIAAAFPDMRLVYMVREPLGRVRSHYAHNVDRALETRPLGVAIRQDSQYLDTSRYAFQLKLYLEHFSPDQILVVDSDRLRHDRRRAFAEIAEFLGVDPSFESAALNRELNQMSDKRLAPDSVNRMRRLLRATRLNRLVSKSMKQRLRMRLSVEMPTDITSLAPEDAAWLLDRLEDDLREFSSLVGFEFRSPSAG